MGNSYWVSDPRAKGGRIRVQTIEPTARQKKSAARRQDEFAMVPLRWAVEVAKAAGTPGAMVWILLLYLAWKNQSTTFPVSNMFMARYGVGRETKRRTLKRLETAGLIKIECNYKRSPIVTLVLLPKIKIT
jgi:hypothetical protein